MINLLTNYPNIESNIKRKPNAIALDKDLQLRKNAIATIIKTGVIK